MAAPSKLLVGLGNPGEQYRQTRHNIGWQALDRYAADNAAEWQMKTAWQAEISQVGEVLAIKPQQFMNRSGQAVLAASQFYKIPTQQMLIVLDEFQLPFGEVRYRDGGSDGGHNGLTDVLAKLGTEDIPRVRIGIGEPTTEDPAQFVLEKFSQDELSQMPRILDEATRVISEQLG